jgi:hypothetical protein
MIEVTHTDLDFTFTRGQTVQLTLRPEDEKMDYPEFVKCRPGVQLLHEKDVSRTTGPFFKSMNRLMPQGSERWI